MTEQKTCFKALKDYYKVISQITDTYIHRDIQRSYCSNFKNFQ
jgi:hypothetical protein